MQRTLIAAGVGAGLALSACAPLPELSVAGVAEDLNANYTYGAFETNAYRAYAAYNQENPFVNGAMSIVSAEHGELHTYTLVPCGATVCGGSAHGPRGRVERHPDYVIVSGLYNRTFWLSPGGDGALVRGRDGATVPLAWDSIHSPQ